MAATAENLAIAEEERLRADLYDFLGALLARPPQQQLLDRTAALQGDDSPLGQAITSLSKVARLTRSASVETEFNKLFIGLGRGELLPYGSYYLTGFLNEKPLAVLRQDMSERGLGRDDTVFEPEDNIASLMEMMAAMIVGRFGSPATLADQKTFFMQHIDPWAGLFFTDLEKAKNSVFYAAVGAAGRAFMEIESEAFRMIAD